MDGHRQLRAALAALLALAAPQALWAEELNISADGMRLVDQVFQFTGSVLVEGEQVRLTADSLHVDSRTYLAGGGPAVLEVANDADTLTVSGPEITYLGDDRIARMDGGGFMSQGQMRVDSGAFRFDIDQRLLVASGDVRIRDGETRASGDDGRLSGASDALRLELTGAPATLELPTDDNGVLTATAQNISYDQARGLVHLEGAARASLGQEDFAGETITYDLKQASFFAEPEEGGRVRATIKTR